MDADLYQWTSKSHSQMYPRRQNQTAMTETHESAADNHSGSRELAPKVKSLGFYWSIFIVDYESYAPDATCVSDMSQISIVRSI